MRRKKIIIGILLLIGVICLWQRSLLYYAYVQASGQLHVVNNTVEVKSLLANPATPDSIKYKLNIINEVKTFAVDCLAINPSDNYTTLYDQEGKPIMWVVTACDPYRLEAKEWSFPFIGSFSYKGFFRHEMAVEEETKWKSQGFDTNIRTAGGWSTLGWFKDPILSKMLERSEGSLAELIIHELTHGTLFVKDSVEFNENLATFIGTKGAEIYLQQYFGGESIEYIAYQQELEDEKKFVAHILRGAHQLDSLYQIFQASWPAEKKSRLKQLMINRIIKNIDTLSLFRLADYQKFYGDYEVNNTFFMSFLRYNKKVDQFEKTYTLEFERNLKEYLLYLKTKYPSL